MRAARIFRLGAHDPLGHRRPGQEGAGDLLGGEAAHLTQRHRDLGVGRQGRMAAGEDEAQPVVLEALVVLVGGPAAAPVRRLAEQAVEPGTSPEPIDRLEAAGRDEPGAGLAACRPGASSTAATEGVLENLLGEVEVAQQADQGGQDLARLGPVEAVDPLAHLGVGAVAHGAERSRVRSMTGRTSTLEAGAGDPARRSGAPRSGLGLR